MLHGPSVTYAFISRRILPNSQTTFAASDLKLCGDARHRRFPGPARRKRWRRARTFAAMKFQIIGDIREVAPIARGASVKIRAYLRKAYGRGMWRKLKGVATIRLASGSTRIVELHWYEAHGIGKRDLKIKRYLDQS
jgi:hypothetical protein